MRRRRRGEGGGNRLNSLQVTKSYCSGTNVKFKKTKIKRQTPTNFGLVKRTGRTWQMSQLNM